MDKTSPPNPSLRRMNALARGNEKEEKMCACCGERPGEHLVVQVGQLWGSPMGFAAPKPGDIVARLCPICYERLFAGCLRKDSIKGAFYGCQQETG